MLRAVLLLLPLLASCTHEIVRDPGPPPGPGHQDAVRAVLLRVLKDDGSTTIQFAPPIRDRLPRYHFEPNQIGPHAMAWVHGWRVDMQVAGNRVYEKGSAAYMAFIRDDRVLGIFTPSRYRNAPMDLDKWGALYAVELPPAAAAPAPR
jgi:hypothetical protein